MKKKLHRPFSAGRKMLRLMDQYFWQTLLAILLCAMALGLIYDEFFMIKPSMNIEMINGNPGTSDQSAFASLLIPAI